MSPDPCDKSRPGRATPREAVGSGDRQCDSSQAHCGPSWNRPQFGPDDFVWRALVTELKAWAVFVPSLVAFCAFAALAIGAPISPILRIVDPPWEAISAVFFWFGLLLFAVVRYAGRRPSTDR